MGRNIWCIYTETNSDDDDCPDDKPKCPEPDCEGDYLGLCTKEPIINCPCDVCLKVEDVFCENEACMGVGEDKNSLENCPYT